MTYSYYHRLSRKQQKIYRASDALAVVKIEQLIELKVLTEALKLQLPTGQVDIVEKCSQALVNALCEQLRFPSAKINVLERRPHNNYGELHGLYEPVERARPRAKIYVWMRTAKRQQVVAFKTYLRTLIHEFCHHLDFEYYKLADSFHTQGFFQRESSIVKQLIG
ncbi:MAG: hypothetical protein AAGB35_02315 [Pseudomonadota bacterium]